MVCFIKDLGNLAIWKTHSSLFYKWPNYKRRFDKHKNVLKTVPMTNISREMYQEIQNNRNVINDKMNRFYKEVAKQELRWKNMKIKWGVENNNWRRNKENIERTSQHWLLLQ